jgi:hypothetical protein
MNNETINTAGNDPLDALFASARQSQPNLMDDNFTKTLINSLPKVNLFERKENAKKGLSFDLIGAMLGLLMAYIFVDGSTLLNSFFASITDSFVISPLMLIMAVGAAALTSLVAWWVVEDNQL